MAEAWTAEDIARLRDTGGMLTNTSAPSAVDPRNVPSSDTGVLVSPTEFSDTGFEQRAARPGIPLDVESGAPGLERYIAGTIRAKEDQLAFWRERYGGDKVDVVDGQFVIRGVPDDAGGLRDITVDERNFSGKDVLDLIGEVPEMILALAAVQKAGARGVGMLGQGLAGAAMFEGFGAAKDIGQRAILGQEIQPGEVGRTRALQAGADLLLGTAVPAGLKNLLSKLAPQPTDIAAVEGTKAIQRLAQDTGIELPQSLAEYTGSQSLARGEAFLEKFIFSRGSIAKMEKDRIDAERALQTFLTGGTEQEAAQLGRRAEGAIAGEVMPLKSASESAQTDAIRSAAIEAISPFQRQIGSTRSSLDLGDALKQGAMQRFDKFKADAQSLYDAVYELPEATQDVFPLGPVAKQAKDILDKLPSSPAQPKTVPGFDAYGSPTEVTIAPAAGSREQIRELTPSGLLAVMEPLAARKGQKTRLFDLVQARDRIYDLINTADPLSSIPQKDLKQIAGSISEAIDSGVSALPSGELKARLTTANKFYRENIGKFQQEGVEEILINSREQRANFSEQLTNQIFAGGKGSAGKYRQFKEFFGDQSPEMNDLRQYFLDNILERSANAETRATDFRKIGDALKKLSPEISEDLFGKNATNMREASMLGEVAEGRVNLDDIKDLITSNQLTLSNVRKAIKAQEQFDRQIRNGIKRGVVDGVLDPKDVDPSTFVDSYLLSKKVPVADVRDAMRVFESSSDPMLVGDIRSKVLNELFRDVAVSGKGTEDLTRRALGESTREIDPQKFALAFDSPETRERMKAILGDETFNLVRDFSLAVSARGRKESLAGMAGAMASGGFLNDLIQGTAGLAQGTRYWLASKALTNPQLVRALKAGGANQRAVWKTLVRLPYFVRGLTEDFTDPMQQAMVAADLKENLIDEQQPTQR